MGEPRESVVSKRVKDLEKEIQAVNGFFKKIGIDNPLSKEALAMSSQMVTFIFVIAKTTANSNVYYYPSVIGLAFLTVALLLNVLTEVFLIILFCGRTSSPPITESFSTSKKNIDTLTADEGIYNLKLEVLKKHVHDETKRNDEIKIMDEKLLQTKVNSVESQIRINRFNDDSEKLLEKTIEEKDNWRKILKIVEALFWLLSSVLLTIVSGSGIGNSGTI